MLQVRSSLQPAAAERSGKVRGRTARPAAKQPWHAAERAAGKAAPQQPPACHAAHGSGRLSLMLRRSLQAAAVAVRAPGRNASARRHCKAVARTAARPVLTAAPLAAPQATLPAVRARPLGAAQGRPEAERLQHLRIASLPLTTRSRRGLVPRLGCSPR